MSLASRSSVASVFSVSRGALITETYAAFAAWDLTLPKSENLARLAETRPFATTSASWLNIVRKVLSRRFDTDGRDRPLVELARRGCDIELWKPILLWHLTLDEFLLKDFLTTWLFSAFEAGAYRIRVEDVLPHVRSIAERGGVIGRDWKESTIDKAAGGLLKTAVDFGLLRGSVVKEFASYHLPEHSFLYLLHALRDQTTDPGKVVGSPDWRMFLMGPAEVEHELLRLHQFRRLDYQVAGSLVQLSLPCATSREYAERMVA